VGIYPTRRFRATPRCLIRFVRLDKFDAVRQSQLSQSRRNHDAIDLAVNTTCSNRSRSEQDRIDAIEDFEE
jgi:hypothetical protein